jgi:hypothetical protein
MKIFARSFVFVLAGSLWFGCADSTPPMTNYPLSLSIVADTSIPATLSVVFSLKVTKDGAPFAGATLVQQDELMNTNLDYNSFDLPKKSDSTGKFPSFYVYYFDTLSEVAFYAVKDTVEDNVKDSLVSNTILVAMP